MKKQLLLISYFISFLILLSCEEESEIHSYNDIYIKKYIKESENLSEIHIYEYDVSELIIKVSYDNNAFSTFDYDSLGRIIRKSNYNAEEKLVSYEIYEHDSNYISRINYSINSRNEWIMSGNKYVFTYNTEDFCTKLSHYQKDDSGIWIEYDSYYTFNWTNGNLTDVFYYYNNVLWYSETYEYDNKSNPGILFTYIISPWSVTINNPIKSTKVLYDGKIETTKYSYMYNAYGYPTEKIITLDSVSYYEKYEYEIK
ncbi:MAG: hypothetical protein GQ564_18365 [Bacteroidales bacterium]|nr:hypothetical protein [Bacteroidales bacterium]